MAQTQSVEYSLDAWAGDRQQLKADFDRDGYVVIRGFLTAEELAHLQEQLKQFIEQTLPGLAAEESFYEIKSQPETLKYIQSLSRHDEYFEAIRQSARFKGLAETLLGGEVEAKHLSLFNKPPRIGDQTPPHQDGYYFRLEPNEALTMWLALEKVDGENGCVRYVPGSHRRGLRPHNKTNTLGFSQGVSDWSENDEDEEVAIEAEAGDLLVHHSLIIHRADPNTSPRTRHALGAVYYLASASVNDEEIEEYQKSLMKNLAEAGKI